MSNLRTLLKHSSHYAVGRVAAFAFGMVSFPVWARLFSVAEYGVLNLAQRFSFFGVAVGKLGMQNAILRFHAEAATSEEGISRLYSTAFFSCGIGSLLCAALCALAFFIAPAAWIQPALSRPLMIASGLIFLRSLSSPLYGFLRVEERTIAFNILDVLTRALALGFGLGAVLLFGRRVEYLLIGLIAAEATVIVAALVLYVPRHRLSPAHFDWKLFRVCFSFGIPLAGSELAVIALSNGERVLIQYYLGSEALGYFAAAATLGLMLQDVIQTPLNLALTPMYTKLWHTEGPKATAAFVARTFELFLIVAGAILAVVFASSREVIVFISSSRYAPAAWMLPPLAVGYMCAASTTFLGVGFWLEKRTSKTVPLVIAALTIKTILNVTLLPFAGLWGAVIPNITGFVVICALYAYYSHRVLPLPLSPYHIACCLGSAAVAAYVGHLATGPGLLGALLARAGATVVVYGFLLWFLDVRVRRAARDGIGYLARRLAPAFRTAP